MMLRFFFHICATGIKIAEGSRDGNAKKYSNKGGRRSNHASRLPYEKIVVTIVERDT